MQPMRNCNKKFLCRSLTAANTTIQIQLCIVSCIYNLQFNTVTWTCHSLHHYDCARQCLIRTMPMQVSRESNGGISSPKDQQTNKTTITELITKEHYS